MQNKIEIRTLAKNEITHFKELILLFSDVFEMKKFKLIDDEYLQKLLATNGFFVIVAQSEDRIVGGLTVYTLQQYYSPKPLAYIFDLAIATNHQRKGIGKQLIEYTKNYLQHFGYEEVFVQADKIDQYAIDFYRKTDPTNEEDVSHFFYSL